MVISIGPPSRLGIFPPEYRVVGSAVIPHFKNLPVALSNNAYRPNRFAGGFPPLKSSGLSVHPLRPRPDVPPPELLRYGTLVGERTSPFGVGRIVQAEEL